MARKRPPKPTERELAILRVLWREGPCTIRRVHEAMAGTHKTGYTTALKLMQIMAEKGLVTRNEKQRAHVYRAKYSQDRTQQQLVGDLVDRAFGGSAHGLVMQALNTRKVTPDELAMIRALLDEHEKGDT